MRATSLALLGLLALPAAAQQRSLPDCAQPASVCAQQQPGAATLIERGIPAQVLVDPGDFPAVQRAVRSLAADLAAVAGQPAASAASPSAIIIGTLGHSARIDRIVREKGIDVSAVKGRWEAYLLQVVDNPEPGIRRALLIAGADRRGTVFGTYELSRRMGVSPWTWWADVPVPRREALYASAGRFVDAPSVHYRGIFLNDEDPALGGWMRATYGGPNHRFYERVFELILRLKGNLLWPAMWGRAFADDDAANPALADEYGVVIGTSHHEPMMRAHVEWERHGKGPWDFARNADELRAFWKHGIERNAGRESLVTIGMRGDGDEPMSQDTAIDLLQRIVADQRTIITDLTGRPASETPQVWALYKEVQDYFDAGMDVPDDVTLLFSDDNWGNLRRLPRPGDQRGGGYGVYYHFDYVGGPRNYKWINTNQIERTWQQMQLAHAYGADRLWIVNVGDLKPMELPISFFLDQAWNPPAMTLERLQHYPADWAAEQFGPEHASEIGDLLTRYTQYNARRKPELLSAETWSLVNFNEARRVLADWDALAQQAVKVGATLPARYRDAYYQLVEYPVVASANLNQYYVALARNRLYAAQGRAATNAQAGEVHRLFARDAELARVYEQDIAGGKWVHMMSQPRIGYTSWQQPERNVMPQVQTIEVPSKASLGVAVEGDLRAWPGTAGLPALRPLDPLNAPSREVIVFNRGSAPLHYTTRASHPWLRVTPARGEVGAERSLRVDIDWNAVPAGSQNGRISIDGSDGTRVEVGVPLTRPALRAGVHGHVEGDGTIAIEAQHHARATGQGWRTIPNLGRTLSGVISLPLVGAADGAPGDRLEYDIDLAGAGEVEVRVVMSPALDFQGRGGLRYAVSIDDEPPQVVTLRADPTPGHADFAAWTRAVSDSVSIGHSRHRVASGGAHVLRLWRVDPGLVFQRLEVVRGELPQSYLGPPENAQR
ncbi:MAG TPA: glycosyl hydrolase 115 family protein [Lysobacter sp.]